MNPTFARLVPAFALLVTDFCQASPLFFIDTPELLRRAEEAAYARYPDIPPSGLVAAADPIDFSCSPGRTRYLQEEASKQCLHSPYVSTPCKAKVRLMVRSTVEQQVSALPNGRCKFVSAYRPVLVDFFQDGALEVRRPDFTFESQRIESCDWNPTPREVAALAESHEAILSREFAAADTRTGDNIVQPDGYFLVDYERLFRSAHRAILRKHPQAKDQDLHLSEADFSFFCGEEINWQHIAPTGGEMPTREPQKGLCYTSLTFANGGSSIEQLQGADGSDPQCRLTTPDRGYLVNLLGDGSGIVIDASLSSSRQGSCEHIDHIPSIDDAIAQYREALSD